MQINLEWKKENGLYECPFCKKEYSNKGISTHIWRSHTEGKNHNPNIGYESGRTIWNKGLNINDVRIKKISKSLSKTAQEQIKNGTYVKRGWAKWNDKQKEYWSKRQSENNSGGKCKWYEIDGVKVQGKWELNIANKLNELGIKWIRCKAFIYEKEGKEKRYTPDFYLPEYDKFLEIKGYWWLNDKEKMILTFEQHPYLLNKIKIIEKELYKNLQKITTKEELEQVWLLHRSEEPTNRVRFSEVPQN